jgi:hypothetical protein
VTADPYTGYSILPQARDLCGGYPEAGDWKKW